MLKRSAKGRRTSLIIPDDVRESLREMFPHGTLTRIVVAVLRAIVNIARTDRELLIDYLKAASWDIDIRDIIYPDALTAVLCPYILFRNTEVGRDATASEFVTFLLRLYSRGRNVDVRLKDLKNIDELSDDDLRAIVQNTRLKAEFSLLISDRSVRDDCVLDEDVLEDRSPEE